METWATFSVIDHRKPIYRQALALFDKIVVPLPPEPIGDQTLDELNQLQAEIEFLAEHNAATLFPWDSDAFQQWRQPYLAEAWSAKLNRDIFQDTRLMIAGEIASNDEVQAVPVYGGHDAYSNSQKNLCHPDEALTMEILQRLPVPDFDTPLEDLIHLRGNPAFRTAMGNMLEWKRREVPAIAIEVEEKRPSAIAAAMRDFDNLTKKYAQAMEAEGHKRVATVGSIFFSVATGEVIGAIKEGLVTFRELKEPCWKKVSDMKCAPGGVVYHFREALQ
jgi:hypothetical protein